jgi:hypothetical protein
MKNTSSITAPLWVIASQGAFAANQKFAGWAMLVTALVIVSVSLLSIYGKRGIE